LKSFSSICAAGAGFFSGEAVGDAVPPARARGFVAGLGSTATAECKIDKDKIDNKQERSGVFIRLS
jgi:hypothetical protein